MNKGLEALEDLWYGKKTTETYQTIENDLKAYEELESMYEELAKSYNKLCQEKIEWLKQKHALEIIKDNLDSGTLGFDFKVGDKKTYELEIYGLTQEEYDLLKEVLL